MNLLKSLSLIITSCAVIIFLIRPRKFQHFISLKKVLKKDKNDSQDDNSQKNKSQEQIINCPELSNPNWIKIGSVKRLYIYPLTGCRTAFPTLKFTKYGISTESEGMTVWDRMFQVYNEETKEFLADQASLLLHVDVLDKSKIQFCVPHFRELIIDIDKKTEETSKILKQITINWNVIKYIDCGEEAAQWIKEYLNNPNYRLVRREHHIIQESEVIKDIEINKTETEILELLMILTCCVVLTTDSDDILSRDFVTYKSVRSNIIISAPSFRAFAEQNWEWIRIGNMIMRKIMPALRLAPKSLYEMMPPFTGILYGLYSYGDMNVNDDVYIHIEDQLSENDSIDDVPC